MARKAVRLTVMVQVEPAATVAPAQVSAVTLKLDALLTASLSVVMTRAAVPVFFTVTVWVALVDSAGVLKVSAVELGEITAATLAVLETATVVEPVLVLFKIVSVAE